MVSKKPVIILNGSGGVGKDTFADLCGDYAPMKHISTVDLVKRAGKILGCNSSKSEAERKFLSDLKQLAVKYCDHSYKYVLEQIELFNPSEYAILFVDCREPAEIKRFANIGCKTLLIVNNRVAPIHTNMADGNVFNYYYDHVIYNNGTLEELSVKAKEFVHSIL